MSTIIINDEAMEGKVGERLLNVARHHGAHIGFMCDNAGTCQGCRCQVLAGGEHLSPPNEAEQAWIPAERLAAGERLACQAIIRSRGEIQVLSRAEELRRMVLSIIAPRPGERRLNGLSPLLATLGRQTADQLALFPGNVLRSLRRLGPVRFAFPSRDQQRILADVRRVVQHMRSGDERSEPTKALPVPITVAAANNTPNRA